MGDDVVLIAVVLAAMAPAIIWPVGRDLPGVSKQPRPPGKLHPLRVLNIVALHVVLGVSYLLGMWTLESVGLHTNQWGLSIAFGLGVFAVYARMIEPVFLSPKPGTTWVEVRAQQRAAARDFAMGWPRSQRAKRLAAGLRLATIPAGNIAFYGILVFGLSDAHDSVAVGALLGGVLQIVCAVRMSRSRALRFLPGYAVSLFLLYAGPGLLGVLAFNLVAAIRGNQLKAGLRWLAAWRSRTRRASALAD